MAEKLAQLKRGLWLFKSADLSPKELFTIAINKIIGTATAFYYALKGLMLRGDRKVVAGYCRYVPKNITHPKKALLSYFRFPLCKQFYVGDMKYYFSNNGCIISIARALNELGYEVDIIDLNNHNYNAKVNYDLVFYPAFDNFDSVLKPYVDAGAANIFFPVVAYWRVIDAGIKERLVDYERRHNVKLPEAELNWFNRKGKVGDHEDELIQKTDGIVIIGDQMSKTYLPPLPPLFHTYTGVILDKGYKKDLSPAHMKETGRNFLFFGGGRDNVRKGLDLILDAIVGTENHLYICGEIHPLISQTVKLDEQPNIHMVGYVKQRSKSFYDLMETCAYIIQPSVSESIPGGVLDCVQYGLIPLVSIGCNMPEEDGGLLIHPVNLLNVQNAINFVTSQTPEWLSQRAQLCRDTVHKKYRTAEFEKDLARGIAEIVKIKKQNEHNKL